MAHRGDGLNDIFDNDVYIKKKLTAGNALIYDNLIAGAVTSGKFTATGTGGFNAEQTPGLSTSAFLCKKDAAVSGNNILWGLSHRSNDKDFLLFGYDGTTFRNYTLWDWDNNKVVFEQDLDMNNNDLVEVGVIYGGKGKFINASTSHTTEQVIIKHDTGRCLRILGAGAYESQGGIYFGDGTYCYIDEDQDDHLHFYGSKGIRAHMSYGGFEVDGGTFTAQDGISYQLHASTTSMAGVSRALDTDYQNTTGHPILVHGSIECQVASFNTDDAYVEVKTDGDSTPTTLWQRIGIDKNEETGQDGGAYLKFSFQIVVQDNDYYGVYATTNGSGAVTLLTWNETNF